MHNSKRFAENVGWLFIGTIASNIVSIAVSIFLIRKLPIGEFGIYSLFMGSLSMFTIFLVGILNTTRRFIPELIQKNYYSYNKSIILKLFLVSVLITFTVVLIIFFNKEFIGKLLNIPNFSLYFSIFIINIFLFIELTFSQDILISLFEQKFLAIVGVISIITRGILYWSFFSNLTVGLILIIEAISTSIIAVPSLIYVYRKITRLTSESNVIINKEHKKEYKRRIKRFVLLSTASEIGEGGFSQVSDYYFVSAFLGPIAMGLYAFPYKIISSIFNWVPVVKLNNIFKPLFIAQYYEKHEDNTYLNNMFNFLIKIYILLYGFIVSGIISYQNLIQVYVFNSKYIETQFLLTIILIFFSIQAFSFPIYMILELKEKIEYTIYAQLFSVFKILSVIFVLQFTNWNLIGVAIATGLANLLRHFYLYLIIKKYHRIHFIINGLVKSFLIIILLALNMYLVSLTDHLILQIFLPSIVGIISFLIFYRILRPFNNAEENILSNFINRFSNKLNIISKIFALNQS